MLWLPNSVEKIAPAGETVRNNGLKKAAEVP
jgi:hypothetical protein